jgi:hypothetical protein
MDDKGLKVKLLELLIDQLSEHPMSLDQMPELASDDAPEHPKVDGDAPMEGEEPALPIGDEEDEEKPFKRFGK